MIWIQRYLYQKQITVKEEQKKQSGKESFYEIHMYGDSGGRH
mgnify:CR=1 FL=1